MRKRCKKHGLTDHAKRAGRTTGWRCRKCAVDAVTLRRKTVKLILVEEAGGACIRCGYNRCVSVLTFHHKNSKQKKFKISTSRIRSLDAMRDEAKKCMLLCANCHGEEHANGS